MNGKIGIDRRAVLMAGGGVAAALAAGSATGTLATAAGGTSPGPTGDGSGLIPVAFVMGNGATMIDFAGPWEVFQDAEVANVPGFYLYTVSDSRDPIMTSGSTVYGEARGLNFRADFTYADAPQPRIIMMGAQGQHTPAKIDWIRKAAAKADYVFSNCTGAFLLAKTGLLDGLSATTHHNFFDKFEKEFPKVKLVRDARYVDNGKFISSGGLTSGIDGALHIVQRIHGPEAAEAVIRYMEYSGDGWRTRARA